MKMMWLAGGIVWGVALTLVYGQDGTPVPSPAGVSNLSSAPAVSCPPSKVWSVTPWGHFQRFTTSVFDWKTVVSPAVTVGFSRLAGIDDGFPRTGNGYARHYGVNVLGNVSGKFFGNFALPTLFQQDEQFQRRGSTTRLLDRVSHVGLHAFWAGQGLTPVNVSSLGGNAINAILANSYQPQSQRTIGATGRRFGLGMLLYVGGDAYTEFSPDLWYALKKVGSAITRPRRTALGLAAPPPEIDYSGLSLDQTKLVSAADWGTWNHSQQVEFLGGTQALVNWCQLDPDCESDLAAHPEPGLAQVTAISKVNGAVANVPSEDQYNISVTWQAGADRCFERARGWGVHLAQLHPGMYGYNQNKANDSLLGLVVLFNRNDSKKGQFHIGFGDIPDHYSADANSNIEDNYPNYCQWYGEIKPYLNCPPPPPAPPPSPAEIALTPFAAPGEANVPVVAAASKEERARLRDTVQAFLEAWYVQADFGRLQEFMAQDNFFHQRGQDPESRWQKYFQDAFKPAGAKPRSLNDAIAYHEMTLPKGSQKLQYLNPNPARDAFAIIDPVSMPRGAYFPPADLPAETLRSLSRRAQYFDHLRRAYPGQLYLVVYATKSPTLVPEGVVLCWILERSAWKLAVGQTTD